MAATLLQPKENTVLKDDQVLTLLENTCSSTTAHSSENSLKDSKYLMPSALHNHNITTSTVCDMDEESQQQQQQQQGEILAYLKSSPSPSCTSKKAARLGSFLLLKTLGVGEFGKVKLGRHIQTGQIVAVKLVKKQHIDSSSQLEKIRMEIDILKTLSHPYIVKLLSVNETHSNIGIVLEYAQGGELFEYIYRQRYLKEQEACRLFSQLISSVHYMHQKNIVHRDLKLENILLDRHNNLIVTDFGFANQFAMKSDDLMSTSCGSPVYAAPELVMTGRLYAGTGVDIWSCGIILYAMLCGYLPFDDDIKNPNGENIGRLYRYIMAHKPKYPHYLSFESRDLIGRMLVPDPSERAKMEEIMAHPWLEGYKERLGKSTQELEREAQNKKQSLLKGINLDIETELNKADCNSTLSSSSLSSSSCSSASSSYSHSDTKDAQANDSVEAEKDDHPNKNNEPVNPSSATSLPPLPSSPTATTLPVSLSMNHIEKLSSNPVLRSDDDNASQTNQKVSQGKEITKSIPRVPVRQSRPESTVKQSTDQQRKRHTIDAAVTTAILQPKETKQRPLPPQQHLSLRAKLLSSVKRRTSSSTSAAPISSEKQKPVNKTRHSWQPATTKSPSDTAVPGPIIVEHSKSERLLSWLKKTKSLQHKKPRTSLNMAKTIATSNSSSTHHSASNHSSKEATIPEEDEDEAIKITTATIPVARPSSSLAPMRSLSTTDTSSARSPRLSSRQDEAILPPSSHPPNNSALPPSSELRVHTGNMNHSALTSKPPMDVLLEISKILMILGLDVENLGGYKLRCTRRSVHSLIPCQAQDTINHLSTRNSASMSINPVYGHPSIDKGEEIQFMVEICRFENLSGLFSVDIQDVSVNKDVAAYQFIGEKLLGLLHFGNTIRNTNFSLMLGSNDL